MKIMVTGGTGFMGSTLVDLLLKEHPNDRIQILRRWRSDGHFQNLDHLPVGAVDFFEGDLTDAWSMRDIIKNAKPDQIYHVAANTFVPYSYGNAADCIDTNGQGTLNLLEAVRHYAPDCKILIVSSCEVYGSHDGPITEQSALNPRSPYGVGKLVEDRIAWMYQQSYGMNILIGRSSSQTGPRKFVGLVDSSWCFQVARMEKGLQVPVLKVGLLTPIRTFCDSVDMVKAYHTFMERGTPGELYNINGDGLLSMQNILDRLKSLSRVTFSVEQDPARIRPTDVKKLQPLCTPFRERFGWKPETPYIQSLENLLNYWRERLK